MASFLRPCTNGCGGQVRFASRWDIPAEVVCDPCVKAIAANEAGANRRAHGGRKKVKTRTVKRSRSTRRQG